jgi:hypothetical protein
MDTSGIGRAPTERNGCGALEPMAEAMVVLYRTTAVSWGETAGRLRKFFTSESTRRVDVITIQRGVAVRAT